MRRRTFDLIASIAGLALAVVLLVGGIIFQQNANFAHDNVESQLRAQKIFFADAATLSDAEKAKAGVVKNAGKQVLTGEQAEVYANDYIALHLEESLDGKTYSELSSESRQNPDDQELAGKVQTAFRGETLRGLLLTTYAFDTLGDKAQQMAIVFFVGSGLFFVLSALGFWHYSRTTHEIQIDV